MALVTGTSRGIGRRVVEQLIRRKRVSKVHAVCILAPELQQLHRDFPDHVVPHQEDLSDWRATEQLLASIPAPIDLLVNNAGVAHLESLGSITEESVDRQLGLNVKSLINVMQGVARKMSTKGAIVNLSSQASHTALQQHLVYCASKAAVDAATRVAAVGRTPRDIRVNPTSNGHQDRHGSGTLVRRVASRHLAGSHPLGALGLGGRSKEDSI